MIKKGFTIDDTTQQWCPGMIPEEWPNTETPVSSMRLFHAWSSAWQSTESRRQEVFRKIADFATNNGVKLLVGTPVTCSQEDDDQNWEWTKELLAELSPSQVMGLAVGNELELLFEKEDIDKECITELWEGGRLLKVLKSRVEEFDKMGFKSVPVTVVFTARVLGGSGVIPFMEVKGQALANSFLVAATQLYGQRFAFTINVYPYFDGNLNFDIITSNPLRRSKSNCSDAIDQATCWDRARCLGPGIMTAARRKITQLTHRIDTTFWIGEIGWSSPRTSTLGTHMEGCDEFSGMAAFEKFYRGFLEWDLTLPSGERGPDHAFFFTLRDSLNFGIQEHFGLINSCESLACKIKTANYQAPDCVLKPGALAWRNYAFAGLGALVLLVAVGTCIYMRCRSVQEWCAGGSKKVSPRKRLVESSSSDSESSG